MFKIRRLQSTVKNLEKQLQQKRMRQHDLV